MTVPSSAPVLAISNVVSELQINRDAFVQSQSSFAYDYEMIIPAYDHD